MRVDATHARAHDPTAPVVRPDPVDFRPGRPRRAHRARGSPAADPGNRRAGHRADGRPLRLARRRHPGHHHLRRPRRQGAVDGAQDRGLRRALGPQQRAGAARFRGLHQRRLQPREPGHRRPRIALRHRLARRALGAAVPGMGSGRAPPLARAGRIQGRLASVGLHEARARGPGHPRPAGQQEAGALPAARARHAVVGHAGRETATRPARCW